MNTLFNILNIIKHLIYLSFALLYSTSVIALGVISVYVGITFMWGIFLCFVYGFGLFSHQYTSYYQKVWINRGSLLKSIWYILIKK